jgi:hypothetical protein
MEAREIPEAEVRSLPLTQQEALLLLTALQNPMLDLGEHERPLCAKVRDLCDGFRTAAAEPEPSAPPAAETSWVERDGRGRSSSPRLNLLRPSHGHPTRRGAAPTAAVETALRPGRSAAAALRVGRRRGGRKG